MVQRNPGVRKRQWDGGGGRRKTRQVVDVVLWRWRLVDLGLVLGLNGEIRRRTPFAALFGQFLQHRGHQQAQRQQAQRQQRTQLLGLQFRRVGAVLLQEVGLFDPVPQLDRVCFQADGPGSAVEFQKQATRVAQDLARLVTAP